MLSCTSHCVAALILSLALSTALGYAQEPDGYEAPANPEQADPSTAPPNAPPSPIIAVHGIVINAATGEPLPRALVQAGGQSGPGTLTDGDGRFEMNVSGWGPQIFELKKPGFYDIPAGAAHNKLPLLNLNGYTHNVFVVQGMPDLSFAMAPANSIRGHIDLSTGEPAEGIGVTLLRKGVVAGRALWRPAGNARSNSDGAFRFGNLADGVYALATDSAKDSEGVADMLQPSDTAPPSYNGYASTYYPDARDFSGAAQLALRGGDSAQANLTLKLEPFYRIRAAVLASKAQSASAGFSASVADAQGHPLPYPAQYDSTTHSIQAMLPDGTYSFQLTAVPRMDTPPAPNRPGVASVIPIEQGSVQFAVAGRPVPNLRIGLSPSSANSIATTVTHNSAQRAAQASENNGEVSVYVSPATLSVLDGMETRMFAQGTVPGYVDTQPLPPGSYWVHTAISQPDVCLSSFTAGGVDLAREPLVVNAGGATAPLTLTLRDDCATLTINMPPEYSTPQKGDEPAFTVYVVPDFDSTEDMAPLTVRPSSGGSIVLPKLTPGSYHVYTFAAPVEFEYRNRDVLSALPGSGQAVTLQPGSNALTLEVPAP